MKWIALLLFSFSLQAQVSGTPSEPLIHCGLESHEEIDACSLEDKFPILLTRLYPALMYKSLDQYNAEDPCDPLTIDDPETPEIEICPIWNPKLDSYSYLEQTYDIDNNPELSFYDRLQMENKPALLVFQTDLSDWKIAEKDNLDFRLSINDMKRFRRRMVKCGYNQPNMALLKLEIINQKDALKRDCLNSHTATLDLEDASALAKDKVIKDMAFSQSIQVDFILLIRSGVKDISRNKRLLTKLNTVQSLLNVGDIEGARDELISISADADFSQGAKDMVLSKLNSYLGQ